MRIIERRKCTASKSDGGKAFELCLNSDQMYTYTRMQEFGWQLYFIRRPLFGKPIVDMTNSTVTRVAVIEHDGRFTVNPLRISWRGKVKPSSGLVSLPG
jgi:hypothetical protein